jgi:phage gp36-like protein
MAVYATVADLVRRYGEAEIQQLTDRLDPPAGAIDSAVAERALADADAEIDAYLAARYAVPMSPAPAVVGRLACDIARFRLWEDRASDEVRRRYEDARRMLEAIAAGRVSFAAEQSAVGVAAVRPARVMRDLEY